MSEDKSWKNVSNYQKNKRHYNKKGTYSKFIKDKSTITKRDLSSLSTARTGTYKQYYSSPKKTTLCSDQTTTNKNTIFEKAKNGLNILNTYPILNNTPDKPLFK